MEAGHAWRRPLRRRPMRGPTATQHPKPCFPCHDKTKKPDKTAMQVVATSLPRRQRAPGIGDIDSAPLQRA
ncbi:hypothetical protein CO2235_MP90023 [Cupriavidus oxalaticus]|uniref:Uncharacterized protein n=1 Tax=Cupriavidus oxalaticus TaxID=96344 RepID=A0A375GQX0_9BURK|nr:hypothetical protein CO2235_MP90023 [Cupriavidus oxalaticus]